jgi:hypothetical protein
MEDVLRLYARPPRRNEPVVVLDERPVVLRDAARPGRGARPGSVGRRDYEYVRRGTANIFCILEPLTGRRLTYASADRKGPAFAKALQRIARRYRHARRIHLVMDNLSTHAKSCVVNALGSKRGARLWRRFKAHFTPKHASWLNIAEMEASLVSRECLARRCIGNLPRLEREVSAWSIAADKARRQVRWTYRVHDARRTFGYSAIKTSRSEH